MRRGRRGGHRVVEFGGSGEDSFVAVVVTKLTGALLFILLLAMVIMALLPKAVDQAGPSRGQDGDDRMPLTITTPERLPESIAGRPYELALAASGASGPARWSVDGPLPEGLEFDPEAGLIRGVPAAGSSAPVELTVRVSDGLSSDSKRIRLIVYRPDSPLTLPSRFDAVLALPRLPWKAWAELGFGFLVLLLVHQVAMNGVATMERRAIGSAVEDGSGLTGARRFSYYRALLRSVTVSAIVALAAWLWMHREARPGQDQGVATPAAGMVSTAEEPGKTERR